MMIIYDKKKAMIVLLFIQCGGLFAIKDYKYILWSVYMSHVPCLFCNSSLVFGRGRGGSFPFLVFTLFLLADFMKMYRACTLDSVLIIYDFFDLVVIWVT